MIDPDLRRRQLEAKRHGKTLQTMLKGIFYPNSIPRPYNGLIGKLQWHCVRSSSDPESFYDALSCKSPNECFRRIGKIIGEELTYDEQREKAEESRENSYTAKSYADTIYLSIAPPGIMGRLKGIYNLISFQAGWYCQRENELPETAIKALLECEDLEHMILLASGLKRGETNFYIPKPLRSDKQQEKAEKEYLDKMMDDGVPLILHGLLFGMLTTGRTKYTHLREYSQEIIEAAKHIYAFDKPMETWKAAETLVWNLKSPKKYTPELLDFADKFSREYPSFSGVKQIGSPDYFRAAGQFYGLTLEEAVKRPFISNKAAEVAKTLAKDCLANAEKVTPEIARLAINTAKAKEEVPLSELYREMAPFKGLTTAEAYDNFGAIMDKGVRIRSLVLMDRLAACCRFDNDPMERMFQKSILQESAYKLTLEKIPISGQFLADMKNCFPEEMSRELDELVKNAAGKQTERELSPEI